MDESDVQKFWQHHPCGDMQVGGLEKFRRDYEAFFEEYDEFRYGKEGHIKARIDLNNLPHQFIRRGSVLELPFENNSFDIVFSHGVLHHVPDIGKAQSEIWRVLKPNGKLIVMIYAKYSLNYLLSITLIRRLGLAALYAVGYDPGGMYGQHLTNARKSGLLDYLKMRNFIHRNTDGPLNPYSKVYDLYTVREDFQNFNIISSYKQFMHAPPLPVKWLPFEKLLGWHLWVEMEPIGKINS